MRLDIYREVRGDSIRPGMIIERPGSAPTGAIDVDAVTVKRDGTIELVGKPAYRAPASVKATTIRVRDTETLRAHPTPEQVLGVWVSLCDAVRSAAGTFLEDQEMAGGEDKMAPPWEVVGPAGQLLVSFRFQGFRVDPELPLPHDDEPVEDEGG